VGKIFTRGGSYLENTAPGYGYAIMDIAIEIAWLLNYAKNKKERI